MECPNCNYTNWQRIFAPHFTKMVYVTRRETFNAAHKLYNPAWDEKKNREVFGKCANPNWHGHNYVLYVTVKGVPHEETGYVIDLKVLSDLIKEHITNKLDHSNLNLDVDFLKNKLPSTENLAVEIFKLLKPLILTNNCLLHSVRLHETENNYVEYLGE